MHIELLYNKRLCLKHRVQVVKDSIFFVLSIFHLTSNSHAKSLCAQKKLRSLNKVSFPRFPFPSAYFDKIPFYKGTNAIVLEAACTNLNSTHFYCFLAECNSVRMHGIPFFPAQNSQFHFTPSRSSFSHDGL